MGSYATTTSVSLRLPNFLRDNTTTSDATATAVISSFIDKAEAKFNAVASKRYSLPFTTVPPMARDLSLEMAAYYTIRAFSSRDWPNRNEMLDDYAKAFDDLDKIGKGELVLSLTDGSLIGARSSLIQSNRDGEKSVFDVDDPDKWKVDKDRLDDIEDDRA